MKEIVIPQKSSAFLKVLIATSIPTSYLGYLFFGFMTNGSAYNVYVMFICSILFFIFLSVLIKSLIQFLNKKPALIINQQGIIDNVSMAKAGFIDWKNISDCFVAKMSGVDQLFIKLKEYDHIVDKQNPIKKGLLSVPISDHGTPIAIDLKVLNYNPAKLQKIIKNRKKGR